MWLIVAGGATFAAFPDWYATWFSALYLALVLVLFALIIRGVSFEYRGRIDQPTMADDVEPGAHRRQPHAAAAVRHRARRPALRAAHRLERRVHRHFIDLLTPYGIWVGITLLSLTLLHGSTFLTLRTTGIVHERARRLARPFALDRHRHGDRVHDLDAGALRPGRHPRAAARRSRSRDRRGAAWAVRDRPRRLGVHRDVDRDRARPSSRSSSTSIPT